MLDVVERCMMQHLMETVVMPQRVEKGEWIKQKTFLGPILDIYSETMADKNQIKYLPLAMFVYYSLHNLHVCIVSGNKVHQTSQVEDKSSAPYALRGF